MSTLDQLKQERLKKLEKLQKMGIDPYPATVKRNQTVLKARTMNEKEVIIAGRVMGLRGHGKLIFGDIVDETGKIQIAFKADLLTKEIFSTVGLIDRGDFLEVSGKVGKTVAGEITVFTNSFRIITKTLQPLPDNWYGFKDVEERYRKRYIDLILNPEVHKRIKIRGKIIQEMRNFLTKRDFIEIETPTLQPIYGGGFAKPFKTYYNALESDFYLRISDEMYLKRLIVGGFEKVFEITKVFRNEGYDFDHNPEFTMFEAQIAYQDYTYGMDLIEEIIENSALSVFGTTKFNYQGVEMNLKKPWTRYSMIEAVTKFAGINPLKWKTLEEAKKAVGKLEIHKDKIHELKGINSLGEIIAFVFEGVVEEKLIYPTIIYDYPIEISPLAKKCQDPRFTQRFEMFAFGSELGNNYTELNDPIDLRKRFIEEKKREKAGFEEAHQTDNDYLEAIEHGFPPTCGIAIGIDRLVMLLTDAKSIKEVIAFPTLRPKEQSIDIKSSSIFPTLSDKRILAIDQVVAEKFPSAKVGVAIIKGVKITKNNLQLTNNIDHFVKSLSNLTTEQIDQFKEIQSYRKLYKAMGVDWHSRRPSPEALLRRIVLKKGLYNVNTCVDAYNLIVMKYHVSAGAFDLDQIVLPTTLRFPKNEEKTLLLGDKESYTYKPTELGYFDQNGGYNVDFNYRDAQRTAVTEKTANLLINVDGIYEISRFEVERTLKEVVDIIIKFCGGTAETIGIVSA